jgi:hypothetical protein
VRLPLYEYESAADSDGKVLHGIYDESGESGEMITTD